MLAKMPSGQELGDDVLRLPVELLGELFDGHGFRELNRRRDRRKIRLRPRRRRRDVEALGPRAARLAVGRRCRASRGRRPRGSRRDGAPGDTGRRRRRARAASAQDERDRPRAAEREDGSAARCAARSLRAGRCAGGPSWGPSASRRRHAAAGLQGRRDRRLPSGRERLRGIGRRRGGERARVPGASVSASARTLGHGRRRTLDFGGDGGSGSARPRARRQRR